MMEQKLNGKKIKLIALDMDGTLLNSCKSLTHRNYEAIDQAIKRGIHVIPATGRPISGLPEKLVSHPKIQYAICSNGAAIVNLDSKRAIYNCSVTKEMAISIIELLSPLDIMIDIFADGKITTEAKNMKRLEDFIIPSNMLPYILDTRYTVEDIKEYIKNGAENIEKINMFFRDEIQRRKVIAELSDYPNILLSSALGVNLEVNNAKANKGHGIQWLSQYLKIDMEETMACGDSSNDESMLRTVGLAVAMGNSTVDIKSIADYITGTNDEDGVAEAIEAFIL